MRNLFSSRYVVAIVSICLVGASAIRPATAAIIPTDTAIEMSDRQVQVDRINEVLAQQEVRDMLVKMGVDPAAARERVASLTDSELQVLHQKMDDMPAAGTGVVEVVGIVAIVLVVLELLNVTDFFKSF